MRNKITNCNDPDVQNLMATIEGNFKRNVMDATNKYFLLFDVIVPDIALLVIKTMICLEFYEEEKNENTTKWETK